MATTTKTDIFVFADWIGIKEPTLIGVLTAQFAKGRKSFSFEYDKQWLLSPHKFLLDPDIQLFSGKQFPNGKENFGVFLDSMPDTWGRTLMKRRAIQIAKEFKETPKTLYDIDYLLGVYDETRIGGLRFKTEINGDFLDNNQDYPTPPWTSVRELQYAVSQLENEDEKHIKQWLEILIAPGSSLGGARPKANILDEKNELWIAKFPSKNDTINKGAWEFLAYRLALNCGIEMSESKIEKINHPHHTFFTKRFDRKEKQRIHFSSAMTMTGNREEKLKEHAASYLDIAEFLMNHGTDIDNNLRQLWKRIVFNIAISNADDHLRNHGFILTENGWILSPAYDLNPSIDKNGLSLNINDVENDLDIELAKSVGEYFRLNITDMNQIIDEVFGSVKNWRNIATEIGISRGEQEGMASAFKNFK